MPLMKKSGRLKPSNNQTLPNNIYSENWYESFQENKNRTGYKTNHIEEMLGTINFYFAHVYKVSRKHSILGNNLFQKKIQSRQSKHW